MHGSHNELEGNVDEVGRLTEIVALGLIVATAQPPGQTFVGTNKYSTELLNQG